MANLEVYKNTNFEETQSLFNITQKLILEYSEEILNRSTFESPSPSWTRLVLSHDQVIQWKKQTSTIRRNLSYFFQFLPALANMCRNTSRSHVVSRWIYLTGLGETPERECILRMAVKLIRCWRRDRVPDVASRHQNHGTVDGNSPGTAQVNQPTNSTRQLLMLSERPVRSW